LFVVHVCVGHEAPLRSTAKQRLESLQSPAPCQALTARGCVWQWLARQSTLSTGRRQVIPGLALNARTTKFFTKQTNTAEYRKLRVPDIIAEAITPSFDCFAATPDCPRGRAPSTAAHGLFSLGGVACVCALSVCAVATLHHSVCHRSIPNVSRCSDRPCGLRRRLWYTNWVSKAYARGGSPFLSQCVRICPTTNLPSRARLPPRAPACASPPPLRRAPPVCSALPARL
jgi:hypothetical protein